ncbi:MAG TPA: hypothetical protein VNX68_16180 [Nitrosopumilaceae archaeon]|jgi:hypothetical protein|nr:hypothetical protein [Nitrosopumilaceae archaeon]
MAQTLNIEETRQLLGAEKPIICTSLIDAFNIYIRRTTMGRPELTQEERNQRKADAIVLRTEKQNERRQDKKERKSVAKEVGRSLLEAFMKQAEDGVEVFRGDAKRVFKLEENFNGTSTLMLRALIKAARQIQHLGYLAEDHLELRHKQSLVATKINKSIRKSIDRRVKRGKLVKVPKITVATVV